MGDNGVLLLVTDAGTHQRDLEESIKEKAAAKNIKIFIMFYPRCHSRRHCGESMPAYESVSEGRIFNGSDFDNENFFESVLNTVRNIYLLGDDVFKEVLKHKLFISLKFRLYRCKTHVKMIQEQQQKSQ